MINLLSSVSESSPTLPTSTSENSRSVSTSTSITELALDPSVVTVSTVDATDATLVSVPLQWIGTIFLEGVGFVAAISAALSVGLRICEDRGGFSARGIVMQTSRIKIVLR